MSKIYNNFHKSVQRYPHRPFLIEPHLTNFRRITYRETWQRVEALINRWSALQIAPGSRIALLAPSSIDWVIAFLAANALGYVVVPLDPQLTEREWINCIRHAEPSIVVVASKFEASLTKLQQASTCFRMGFHFDSLSSPFRQWEAFDAWTKPIEENNTTPVRAEVDQDVAMILYTSGTGGSPLAVQITEEALLSNAESLGGFVKAKPGRERVFSIAPFHHILGLNSLMPVICFAGSLIVFPKIERENMMQALREIRPSFVIAIPIFYETVAAAVRDVLMSEAPAFVNARLNKYLNSGRADPPKFRFWRKWVFRKIYNGFGGRVRAMACGGAPLDMTVNRFFHYVGLPLYEGYGMTETTGMFVTNRPGFNRIGTIGQRFAPDTEVCLKGENDEGVGEICLKGSLLMKGYYRNPEADRQAFDQEDWFHTGDLARMDAASFLTYVGRKKDVIVTSNGKNIYPEELEEHFSQLAMVKELCVFGLPSTSDNRKEKIHLHIVPDEAAVRRLGEVEICAQIKAQTAELSKQLAEYKRPTSIAFSYQPMPRTTSLKIKKYQVKEKMIRELGLHSKSSEKTRYGDRKLTSVETRILMEIKKLLPTGVEVTPDSHFKLDLGLESLTLMALWTKLERMMNITIEAEEVGRWQYVQDVFDYLVAQGCILERTAINANRLSAISATEQSRH